MAKNIRVRELAAELGMTDAETVDLCGVLGVPIKSHSSSLNEAYADMVRRRAVRDGLARNAQATPESHTAREVARRAQPPEAAPARAARSQPARPKRKPPSSVTHDVVSSQAPISDKSAVPAPFRDAFEWAENFYPYPVAALVRSTRVSDDVHALRDAYLKLGESLVRTYGVVVVGAAGVSVPEVFGKGAISTGTWLSATRDLWQTAQIAGDSAWSDSKGTVGWHLAQLVALRNRTHHKHGLDSPTKVTAVGRQAREHIQAVLEQSTWMSRSRWVGVGRCEYTTEGHVLRARVLRGSDSQWIRDDIVVAEPAVPGSVIAFDSESGRVVDISAVARMLECVECMRDELFTLDAVGATSTFVCTAGHARKISAA